ncbi:PfEMP1 [Plasmodium falciparum Dd2]|uniref:PfEMP1 n=2 Tax=Plasmodium falciparum TaxID=5833 RepID=A0A0L7LWY0_PLAF4|nr:PfEMP1 [Plasmodium falciparum Dd2]
MAPKRRRINEIELSARDVLEKIGRHIKDERVKSSKYINRLKGNLSNAIFIDGLRRAHNLTSHGPGDSCSLDHKFHTNIPIEAARNPCYGREQNRFGENAESYCNSDKIRGNENNSNAGACAPFRRQNMCDKNLEYLINENTKTTHDLLGNVLVTAKYEGASIVEKHPNRGSSEVCTALARSFADIGDIVRGKDMFKPNEKDAVQNGLKKVFKKIYEDLKNKQISDYDGDGPEYYKLREAWWTENRNQVWRALTCGAGEKDTYFVQLDDSKRLFWDRKCGHDERNVPTNLDYVPQYLRWFDEWAEDFCRIRKDKLKKIKNACRNYANNLYCSFNGYDCTKIIWKEHNFSNDSKCTKCHNECLRYENWIKDQKLKFEKQRDKYEIEKNRYNSLTNSKNNFNNIYYKEFYDELRVNYGSIENFLNLLNKGNKCKNISDEEGKIDFDKGVDNTFSRSNYCQRCPDCGVECKNGRCKKKMDTGNNCGEPYIYNIPKNVNPIGINILNSDDEHVDIVKRLSEFCRDSKKENGKNTEIWHCYYIGDKHNQCKMEKAVAENKHQTKITTFDFFFDLWIKNLLRDTINWKSELKNCINNKNTEKCNKECNENCKCFEKWVKQKEQEWKNVKKVFENKNGTSQNYYNKLKSHFDNYFFLVINNVNQGEEKWKKFTDELRKKMDFSKANTGTNDAQDSIKILLDHEKKNAGTCLENNPSEPCSKAEPQKSEEKNQPQDAPPNSCGAAGDKNGKTASVEQICKDVKRYITENNEKTKNQRNTGCNKKGNSKKWECEKNIDPKHAGACMPPRRQTLCIYYLSHDKEKDNIKTAEKLKDGVMKSAALETHFLWEKYKTDKNGGNSGKTLDDQLKEGNIPEDFKRQMFYTYGDYRDLFFGTDISNHRYIIAVKNNVNMALTQNVSEKTRNLNNIKNEWWQKHGPEIWMGMLCALTNGIDNTKEKNKIMEHPKYKNPPEDFAKKPQFLRWYIEWSDEFCQERKKLEKKVETACKSDYDGCKNNKSNGNCGKACKAYEGYITGKKTQYDSQKKKFDAVKSGGEQEYNDISSKEAPDYLKENCLDDTCDCMKKVKSISNYWEQPHTTYNDENLQKKCSCPPSPCTIVDGILGDKSSKGYVEGCKWKYGKMPRGGLEGWECNSGNEDGDVVCIPPRRQRLYVGNLKTLAEGATKIQLRQAFIESAAIETFFAWHEFKKEKEREEKVKNEENVTYTPSAEKNIQKDLQSGKIPEEFKRQMFYTFGDYRDILFGYNIGNGNYMEKVKSNIDRVFTKGSQKSGGEKNGVEEREEWWTNHAKDIWDGILCALSYNTETKEMDKDVRTQLTGPKSMYKYESVTISSVPIGRASSGDITLQDFAKRHPYFRWLEEWLDEFCQKKKIKIDKIERECRGNNGNRYSSGDGEDCTKIDPNKDGTIENLEYPSCAKSCSSYEEWINTKKKEFNKHNEKYENKIEDAKSKNYDIGFYTTLKEKYPKATDFLQTLKERPYYKGNTGNSTIDFKNPTVTFRHEKNCDPCPVFGVECNHGVCSGAKKKKCEEKTFITAEDIEKKTETINVDMLVSDDITAGFHDLKDCEKAGIFKGIRKHEWICGNFCKSDVCVLKTSAEKKDDKQNIQIRALFKRWLEIFLKDYNKINKKISHCMKNDEGFTCINGCEKKCNCVSKWINLKKEEWGKVRDSYIKRYIGNDSEVYEVRSFLEQAPFDSDVQKAIKPFEKLRDFEDSIVCNGTTSARKEKGTEKDVVECLLDKLQKQIETCQTKHKETSGNTCSPPPNPDTQTDTPLPLESFPPSFCNVPANPCGKPDATNVVNVEEVAEILHQEAKEKMVKNSVVHGKGESGNGKSSLQGNIKNAKLKNGRTGTALNNVCSITKEHTNDTRGSTNGGPCKGKDNDNNGERMKIGTIWQTKNDLQITDPYLFLPPRREHICTSNLEKIHVGNVTSSSNINDTFLVDVLLAAKMDAEKIKDLYKSQNGKNNLNDENDKETICRAMKYSFADLGDIIKGTDLWGHKDFNDLETKLVTIFEKIKGELGDKYTGDEANRSYTQLRADWWEANREEVWEAMKCKTTIKPPVNIKCGDTPPLVDYIPQRLRWMTEWSEWYCKVQKEAYEELEKTCKDCRSGICENGKDDCSKCTKACEEYNNKIKPWKQQWTKIKEKYEELYKKAQNSDTSNSGTTYPKDEKNVVEFLSQLYEKNKGSNTIYSTAAGFIHQEAHINDCQKQTLFCRNPSAITSSDTNNDQYAFRIQPYDHDDACICKIRYPEKEVLKEPCDIVETLLSAQTQIYNIHNCKQKQEAKWKCDDTNLVQEKGVCVPPRTQNLCVYYLTELNDEAKEEELREAFIKTAAAETFLSWQYYNSKNVEDAELLYSGIIPSEFLRSMFYTFGDYRDICLDTDIPSKMSGGDLAQAKDNIGKILSKKSKTLDDKIVGVDRVGWWKEYCPHIWEGMLCALTHDLYEKDIKAQIKDHYSYQNLKNPNNGISSLEDFVKRPPFLRWFTEWGDQFCTARGIKIKELKEQCEQCNVNDSDGTCDNKDKCNECKDQCQKYETWLTMWKDNYEKQSKKYFHDNQNKKFESTSAKDEVKVSSHAYDYLQKALTKLCPHGNCSCMDGESKKTITKSGNNSHNSRMPKSLDYPPDNYDKKCNCLGVPLSPPPASGEQKVPVPKKPVPEKKEEEPPEPTSGEKNPEETPKAPEPEKVPPEPAAAPKKPPEQKKRQPLQPPQPYLPPALKNAMLSSTIMWSVGIGFAALTYFLLKKKSKSSVDLIRVLDIHKGDYGIPTPKSKNRYIPYVSDTYKGKTYIYMEGDSGDDDKYMFLSDTTDITSSSESEYEELDINDIYVPGSPKYKTLIEVVLEPSKGNGNTPSKGDGNTLGDDMVPTTNTFTDEEWNELKHDFISQYIQSRLPMDVPKVGVSKELPMNIGGNVLDDGINEKPFITSIHDRDLYTGEEISYNINMSTNSMDDPKYVSNNVYSGIDLINDTLSGNQHIDIYDEVLKRKENELFGTNHTKNTSNNNVAKLTNSDPIMNQLDLLHTWLDRHRDMCEKWNKKEELLEKLNEQWNKDNDGGNIPSDNHVLNTDVSIEIDMDNPKPINQFSNMDINVDTPTMDNMEDDIYYDVNDNDDDNDQPSVYDIPMDHNKVDVDVPKKVHIEMKILNNTSNGSLEQQFPISDVWNI